MSSGGRAASFFGYMVAGLAAAALVLYLFPGLLEMPRPVVEVRQVIRNAEPEPAERDATPASYAEAVAQAGPAVVNIFSTKVVTEGRNPLLDDLFLRHFFGNQYRGVPRQRLETSLGSGVIVSSDGYILTNHHVIADGSQIRVALANGEDLHTEIVGIDLETDLAVLKVDRTGLPSMAIAPSGSLRVGDVVLAIGNPFGVGQTVTQGIVSATGRSELGINTFEDFIQTDAAINPGNSGGALVNAYGELIGINTAIFSRSGGHQGIGFAIPMSLAREVMTMIIEDGRVIRGWMGIEGQEARQLAARLAEHYSLHAESGLVVTGVFRAGPAQRGGIQLGDVIQSVDGEPVRTMPDLLNRIARMRPGSLVEVAGLRGDQPRAWQIELGERPTEGWR